MATLDLEIRHAVGHRGWLGIYLDVAVDWDEVETLVHAAYV